MMNNLEYAGFWIRVGASLIDTLILLLVTTPILLMIYGDNYWTSESILMGTWDFIISYIFPAIAVIVFWTYKSATPGKMALKLTILDANTGQKPSTSQFIIRYLGYFVSTIPLCLGLIWVGIDKRKQGWHDKMAGTVVVRNTAIEPVEFEQKQD
ncbi:RDD family protein [Thiomicrorhabdus sp.]|uniref:RDD family protein n=1 Tax=Thiomicrorhabdus sp. TaxID=2039724 RepID=UPI002AA8C5C5|nr:RDD family protein [Thiomicrorhabdus sp.]